MNKKGPFIEHKIIEVFDLDPKFLKNSKLIFPKIKDFISKINLKVLNEKCHDFFPYGTTLIFILSSSHLAIHTWPENKYLHMDLVTCAKIPEDEELIEAITEIFGISKDKIKIRKINYEKD